MSSNIKSESADTAEEFYEQAKSVLTGLGARDPAVGESGTIPVQSPGQFEVQELEIYNSTRTGQKVLNQFPRSPDERVITSGYDRPICNVMPCSVTQFLGIDCTRTVEDYIDPKIEVENVPTGIPEVTAHFNPFNPRITGTVEVSGENFSEPGKVKRETVYKCIDEKENEEEVIDDSSIVTMESTHNIIDRAVDETVDTVRTVIPEVNAGGSDSTDVDFRKEGALQLLEGIIDGWVSGTMTGRVTGDINVEYEWKNSVKTETFTIDSLVTLPVRNINYDW